MAFEGDAIAGLLSQFGRSDEEVEAQALLPVDADAFADTSAGGSEQKADEISPEDAAWADSCLVADPELSDESWSALKEALLETLSAQDTVFDTPVAAADADEMQQEEEGEGDERSRVCEESEASNEQLLSDGLEEGDGGSDAGASVGSGEDMESLEGIFRVWDLETPDEEDELIKQLKKALVESRLRVAPSSLDDPSAALNEQKLDELVTGMADLSLKQFSHSELD